MKRYISKAYVLWVFGSVPNMKMCITLVRFQPIDASVLRGKYKNIKIWQIYVFHV